MGAPAGAFPWPPTGPNAQKCDADHRRRGAAPLYLPPDGCWEDEGYVMTWTSDRTGVLLYTIIGMLFVLSSVYLPA